MSQLIESIKIYNGRVYNIKWHNARCNASRKAIFGSEDHLNLRPFISIPPAFQVGLVKCRIIYNEAVIAVNFEPYSLKDIKNVAVVEIGKVDYSHKYLDRSNLAVFRKNYAPYDEIIMCRNGLLTDAYYYNIVLEINGALLTPENPLLNGTRRAHLLKSEKIQAAPLHLEDLKRTTNIHLINALTPLGRIKIPTRDLVIIQSC